LRVAHVHVEKIVVTQRQPGLLAGGGSGSLVTGRHIQYRQDMPLNNLFMSMLDRMGVPAMAVGDSTARLQDLSL